MARAFLPPTVAGQMSANVTAARELAAVLLATRMHAAPVGFEPTRGDPIGLAGRHLSHSAKVSMLTFGATRQFRAAADD